MRLAEMALDAAIALDRATRNEEHDPRYAVDFLAAVRASQNPTVIIAAARAYRDAGLGAPITTNALAACLQDIGDASPDTVKGFCVAFHKEALVRGL